MDNEDTEVYQQQTADLIMDVLLLVFIVGIICFMFIAGAKIAGLI